MTGSVKSTESGELGFSRNISQALPTQHDDRQSATHDKHDVTRQPDPFEYGKRATLDIVERTCVEVAERDRVIELQDAQRKQGRKTHPCETQIEGPETDLRQPVRPLVFGDHVA